MHKHNPSRRNFIGNMLTLAGGSALPFSLNLAAMGNAAAQTAGDYKALICLFLVGGNDSFNTLLATDSASWSEYQRIRATPDAGSIALPGIGAAGGVLPITPASSQAGRTFALHPSMGPVKSLFDAGRVAAIVNVGTLVQPVTLAQYKAGTVALPPRLFSHNDQQAFWQSAQTESTATSGWGGRITDLMVAGGSNATFSAISTVGNALFVTGKQVTHYQISGAVATPINRLNESLFSTPASANPMRQIISAASSDLFRKEYAAVTTRAINSQAAMHSAMLPESAVPAPSMYLNPANSVLGVNPLAVQLQTVARIIGGRNALGVKRQVFYVSVGGFDTHDIQRVNQATLLARVAHAMAYFDGVMSDLQGTDLSKQVTLFTASDFGRTFASNGDGTDHGWGGHHLIMGGAVKGRDIYGAMPVTGLGHSLDVGSGALLPTISVDQYGATLASWFGLSATQIADVFPNIVNFSIRNLGFMHAA